MGGINYTGSGVKDCWGYQAGIVDSNHFIPVIAYMFLPSDSADVTTPGFRWKTDETVNIRLTIAEVDNKQTAVKLADSILGIAQLSAITGALIFAIVF